MKYVIVTGTVTYAIRGRDALRKAGVRATVERNSLGLGRYGCGYGIAIHDDIENAIEILKSNSIKIIEVNPVK
jgi:hypothetical protein